MNPKLRQMEGLIINRARPEEAEWAGQLMAGSEPWITLGTAIAQSIKAFTDPEYHVFVATVNGMNAGFIISHPRGVASSPYIKLICVDQQYRSHGLGATMMQFIENYFAKESKHIFLCVSSFNTGAQKFYTNLGYKPVGVLEDYIIKGESETIMYKRLA